MGKLRYVRRYSDNVTGGCWEGCLEGMRGDFGIAWVVEGWNYCEELEGKLGGVGGRCE